MAGCPFGSYLTTEGTGEKRRGRTYRQAQEAQNETRIVNFSFVAFAHFRGGIFLPSSVSSAVNLKLKN